MPNDLAAPLPPMSDAWRRYREQMMPATAAQQQSASSPASVPAPAGETWRTTLATAGQGLAPSGPAAQPAMPGAPADPVQAYQAFMTAVRESRAQESPRDAPAAQTEQQPPAPRGAGGVASGLADMGRGALYGLATLPAMFGEAAQFSNRAAGGDGELGTGLAETRDAVTEAAPWLQESDAGRAREGALDLRGQAYESGQALTQSLALPVAGALAGTAIAGPVGGFIGGIGGLAAQIFGFAGSQGQQTYEKVRASQRADLEDQGITIGPEQEQAIEDAAMRAGLINAAIEGGGEAVTAAVTFGAARAVPRNLRKGITDAVARRLGLPTPAGDLVQSIASNKGAYWRAVKDVATVVIPTEIATEMAQSAGQQYVEHIHGAGDAPTWNDAMHVVIPTMVMAGFAGTGAHVVGGRRRAEINRLLSQPDDGTDAGLLARVKAAAAVEEAVKKEDPELATIWRRYAAAALGDNRPMVVDEDGFYREWAQTGGIPGADPGGNDDAGAGPPPAGAGAAGDGRFSPADAGDAAGAPGARGPDPAAPVAAGRNPDAAPAEQSGAAPMAPEINAVDWDPEPFDAGAREDLVFGDDLTTPTGRRAIATEARRSKDGAWVWQREIGADDGEILGDTVIPSARYRDWLDQEEREINEDVRGWQAQHQGEPWPKAWQDRLTALRAARAKLPAAPAPSAGATDAGAGGASRSGRYVTLRPDEIQVDAERFQFRSQADSSGDTGRLEGVKTWDPAAAGAVVVWEAKDGTRYVADGHHRVNLAKKLAAEGQDVQIDAQVWREADGVTAEHARQRAAIKNIQEGNSDALDIARLWRELNPVERDDVLPRLPRLGNTAIRDGEALAQLGDQAWEIAREGKIPPAHAAEVARVLEEDAEQVAVLAYLRKHPANNANQARLVAEQMRDATFEAKASSAQGDLFGEAQMVESLYLERAKVIDAAVRTLTKDRAVFNLLQREASRIEGAGNRLERGANQARVQENDTVATVLRAEANVVGPISDAVREAARRVRKGAAPGTAARAVVDAVRAMLEQRGGRLGGSQAAAQDAAAAPETDSAPEAAPDAGEPAAPDPAAFSLESYTEEDLAEQSAAEQAREEAEAAEAEAGRQAAAAETARRTFSLSGSDAPADRAAAAGQQDLLGAAPDTERDAATMPGACALHALRQALDGSAADGAPAFNTRRWRRIAAAMIRAAERGLDRGARKRENVERGQAIAQAIVDRWRRALGMDAEVRVRADALGARLERERESGRMTIYLPESYLGNLARDDAPLAARAAAVESLLHEFGHAVDYEILRQLPAADRQALSDAYQAWRAAQEDASTRDIGRSRLTPMRAGVGEVWDPTEPTPELREYLLKESEWIADNLARALLGRELLTDDAQVQSLFGAIAEQVRRLYVRLLRAMGYGGADRTVEAWVAARLRHIEGGAGGIAEGYTQYTAADSAAPTGAPDGDAADLQRGDRVQAPRAGARGRSRAVPDGQLELELFAPEGAATQSRAAAAAAAAPQAPLAPQPAPPPNAALDGDGVEYAPVQTYRASITRANTPEDVAAATRDLGRAAQEHFLAVITDAGGNILRIARLFGGDRNSAPVNAGLAAAAAHNTPGAANVWWVHNHPSGRAFLSGADMALAVRMDGVLANTGVESRGILAVTQEGRFAFSAGKQYTPAQIEARAQATMDGRPPADSDRFDDAIPKGEGARADLPVVERLLPAKREQRPAVTSPTRAERALDAHSQGRDGILLLDNRNRPVGFVPLSVEEASRLRQGAGSPAARLYAAIDQANASAMVASFLAPGAALELQRAAGANLAAFAKVTNVEMLDLRAPHGWHSQGAHAPWDAQQTFFSREPIISPIGRVLDDAPQPPGVPAHEVQAVVDAYLGRLLGDARDLVRVRVVATQDDAFGPGSRERLGRVRGAFDPATGEIILVAENLGSTRAVRTVLRHEAVGHFGWHSLSAEQRAELARRIEAAAKTNRALRRLWAEERAKDPNLPAAVVAEEVFARATELDRGVLGASWDRVLLWLRDQLAALGLLSPSMGLTDLRVLARDIARGLRAGAERTGARAAGVRYTFAGERAATADTLALDTARARLDAGEDADAVRRATGWFRGDDGKWRFEIDDSHARLKNLERSRRVPGLADGDGPLGGLLEHPRLFAAYPDLAEIEVEIRIDPGRSEGGEGRIIRTAPARDMGEWGELFAPPPRIEVLARDEAEARRVLLHEVQHGVQHEEGFAAGGSPAAMAQKYNEARARLNALEGDADVQAAQAKLDEIDERMYGGAITEAEAERERQSLRASEPALVELERTLRRLRESSPDGFDAYRRLAGEIEARNAEARADMTPEQRRQTGPDAARDVPAADAIVVFNGQDAASAPRPANAELVDSVEQLPDTIDVDGTERPATTDVRFSRRASPAVARLKRGAGPLRPAAGGTRVTVRQAAEQLLADTRRAHPDGLDMNSEEGLRTAVNIAATEVRFQLEAAESGKDWYNKDVAEAFWLSSHTVPRLRDDANLRVLMTAIAAVTSYQNAANRNWGAATRILEVYEATGQFPPRNPANGEPWTVRPGTETGIRLIQYLRDTLGEAGAARWLLAEHTIGEIAAMRRGSGLYRGGDRTRPLSEYRPEGVTGKLDSLRLGMFVLGPKGGPFALNLNGIEDTTGDKWFARTIGRYFGHLLDPARLRQGEDTIAAPTNRERAVMQRITRDVGKRLGLMRHDVQALLWYFEQRIYHDLGASREATRFSQGAREHLAARAIRPGPRPDDWEHHGSQVFAVAGAAASEPARAADRRGPEPVRPGRDLATEQAAEHDRFTLAPPGDGGGSPLGGGAALRAAIRETLNDPRRRLGESWRQSLPTLLGALTLRQLAEVAERTLPGLDAYVGERQRMESRRNDMIDDSGAFGDAWETWARKPANRAQARLVADLMHQATLEQVDPSDWQPLMVAVKLGPGDMFWRERPATEDAAKDLAKRARQLVRSRKTEDKGLAPYYMLAARKVRNAAKAEKARLAAKPGLDALWAQLSRGRRWDNSGTPYASRDAAQVAIAERSGRNGDVRGIVVPRELLDDDGNSQGWVLQEMAGQDIFEMARDAYKRRSEDMMAALVARVRESQAITDPKDKTELIARIRAQFEQTTDEAGNPRIGPYFPLQRFGRLYAMMRRLPTGKAREFRKGNGEPFASESAARSAQTRRDIRDVYTRPEELPDGSGWVLREVGEPWFAMFEHETERRRTIERMQGQGWTLVKRGVSAEATASGEQVTEGFVATAVQKMRQGGDKDGADMLYQMYLSQLQEMSVRKHFIHRKGTAGYSADALRAFGWNMTRLAHQIAKLEHVPRLERLLADVQQGVKDRSKAAIDAGGDADETVADHYLQELQKRHEWIVSPDNAPWTNAVSAAGFFWYLGVTPGAALVNLTQNPILGLPVLAARHGWKASAAAMSKAFADVARGFNPRVIKSFLTGRPIPSDAANLSAEERRAFGQWQRSGVRDRTQAHNLAGIGEQDTLANSPWFNRGMAVVASGFHAAEVVNRDVMLLASYRLARAAGDGHEAAVRKAEDATWEAHFDYSNANRARYMQSNVAKVLLMFRSYSQHMTWFMGRNLYQMLQGESAEVRREAKAKFLGMLGMTGLFAGSVGLPGLGVIYATLNALQSAFGDDDEPWDAEIEFRNWLAQTFPAGVSDILDRGVANTLTGLDWSSRVSLRELWWRSPDRDLDGRGAYAHAVEQLLGPVGGIASAPFQAADWIAEGQWDRAAEAATPKFVRDALRAVRYADEGVLTKRGLEVVPRESLSAYELLWKGLGLNPDQISVRYQGSSAVKLYEQRVIDRRQRLQSAYALASMAGDAEAMARLQPRITAFNRAWPQYPISPRTIRAAIQSRERAREDSAHGIRVNRRLESLREAGAFAE